MRAINELQHIKAADNIYFKDWSTRDQVAAEQDLVKALRPELWDKGDGNGFR